MATCVPRRSRRSASAAPCSASLASPPMAWPIRWPGPTPRSSTWAGPPRPWKKRDFQYTLSLENLGVRPDQLVSWYVWADDTGPDGKPRRTTGTWDFAEIRPFDEIFRENKGMSPSDQQGNAPDQGGDNQKLTELQKQIISATWKLQRDPGRAEVCGRHQGRARFPGRRPAQAGDNRKEAEDPRAQALWTAVAQSMQQALAQLDQAGKSPSALAPALGAEQAAYQNLLSLQARETQVSRGRSGGRGRGGASQRQLDQLDLTQEQNRYETQRDAAPAESPEQRERLQVMNRLQELARRQQDVNDRLKEMQTALQEARTEQEREELRQQLKRLQDEQQQVLADTDELRQRLDQQEDRSNMSEQAPAARPDPLRCAAGGGCGRPGRGGPGAGCGHAGPAAVPGHARTAAPAEFQPVRRRPARHAGAGPRARRAGGGRSAQQLGRVGRRRPAQRLSDAADAGPAQALAAQKQRLTDLVNRAKQVSHKRRIPSRSLPRSSTTACASSARADDNTAKEFQQQLLNNGLLTRTPQRPADQSGGPGRHQVPRSDLRPAQQGDLPQAGAAEQRARAGINDLKDGVEQAAESVIGDDTAALKMAQSELDAVTDQLKQEAAPQPGSPAPGGQGQAKNPSVASAAPSAGQPGRGQSRARDRQIRARQARPNQGSRRRTASKGRRGGRRKPVSRGRAGKPARAVGRPRRVPAGLPAWPTALLAAPRAAGAGEVGGDPPDSKNLLGGGDRGAAATAIPSPATAMGNGRTGCAMWRRSSTRPICAMPVAAARERARLLRQDYTRNLKKPGLGGLPARRSSSRCWRSATSISDELARRQSKDSLVPIDRRSGAQSLRRIGARSTTRNWGRTNDGARSPLPAAFPVHRTGRADLLRMRTGSGRFAPSLLFAP